MKKSLKNYIEIFLGLLIGVGLFMPYVFDLIPMEFIFSDEIDFLVAFLVIIPILVIIPFLKAKVGTEYFYVEDVRHCLVGQKQTIEIQLKGGYLTPIGIIGSIRHMNWEN